MRRVRYSVAMSLDGFIIDADGKFDWILMDPGHRLRGAFRSIRYRHHGTKDIRDNAAAGRLETRNANLCVFLNAQTKRLPGRNRFQLAPPNTGPAQSQSGNRHLALRRRLALPQPP